MVKFIVGLILIASIILWPSPGQADAPCIPPIGAKWINMPINYTLDGSISADIIREASRDWKTIAIRFQESQTSKNFILAGKLAPTELARTIIIAPGKETASFTIILDTSKMNRFTTVLTLTHEFGHVLGFGHPVCTDSIMHSPIFALNLTEGDIAARDTLYPTYRLYLPLVQHQTIK